MYENIIGNKKQIKLLTTNSLQDLVPSHQPSTLRVWSQFIVLCTWHCLFWHTKFQPAQQTMVDITCTHICWPSFWKNIWFYPDLWEWAIALHGRLLVPLLGFLQISFILFIISRCRNMSRNGTTIIYDFTYSFKEYFHKACHQTEACRVSTYLPNSERPLGGQKYILKSQNNSQEFTRTFRNAQEALQVTQRPCWWLR
jgi:hypothetical protein